MKNRLLMLMICGIFTILSLNIVFSGDSDLVNLTNQQYNIDSLNMSGNDTNFTTYNYLNVDLSVNFTSNNTNLTNDEVWYQWFLDGVNVLKGFGRNVLSLFFESDDLGTHLVQVNASTTENGTNDIWSNDVVWNISVIQPVLEPDYIFTDEEIYDSVDITCNHKYTGHVWLYDIDVLVTLQNTSREWIKATPSLTTSNIVHFITRDYLDDRNVTIRCRTYNTYFNYSNYTYSQPIWKKSVNDVRLFRIFNKPIFVGQLNAFESECDMSKNNKYEILYHWMDGNADGTYDKLMAYVDGSNQNKSTFLFETKYILSGQQSINTGCIIKKLTSESWEFSYCNEEEETCAVQKTFKIEVFE